ISNRLTGGPSNSGCLSNEEQMGEGWSDILACLLTMDTSVANPVYRPIGTFATSEPTTGGGIRNAPYDTSFVVNDYTYGDVADVANVSQPHGIGFVWATMLWDLNWAFINQYGFDANIESGTGGNNMVLELIIEGLKLQPCSPGFVDGRDAILQADQLLNNGVNQCLIWSVFAKRGLGFSASQGSSNSRTDQVEAFDVPPICAIATSPPNAAFDANTYQTCSGFIQFEDLSTNTPQNWMWDFGDGATDTIQNPSHVYGSPGLYTVKLIVSNSIGVDSLIEIDFITVTIPDNPIVVNGQGCSTDSILLSATGTYDIHWTDLSGNLLAVGNDYHTVPSTTSSSYYAVNVQDFTNAYVGPLDNSIGAGGNHNTAFIGAINFEAETELTIYSAWVESGSAGIRTVTLWDAYNSGGNAIQVVDVDIPFVGAGRVELGFHIPGPGQYSIGLSNADLYRNNSGANYPYVLPGLMTIVSSSATTTPADFYYYFYDLEVSETSCSSDSVLVTATVANTDFDWNNIGLTANFFDLTTGGSSWLWNFGDGATSTVQNPIHTYSGYGNYNVSLQVDGGCTVSYEILIDNNLGLSNSTGNNFEILLFPNPANDELNISFNKVLTTQAIIEIFSIDGKLVQTACIGVGRNSTTISVANLASQVYFLKLNYNDGIQVKKLVVD
ncbi:MAG: M36 family metallopeptidase, partial [Putridiphycobacter sp.]|nr:M36 family metallopeptidase [Putridiphycobacter sp.]